MILTPDSWILDSGFSILYTARTMRAAIGRIFSESIAVKRSFLRGNATVLARVIDITCDTLATGRTLFFFGNGGSAADAQHLAAEFVNRFKLARAPLPAIALTTDTSALTSIANDFGYREVFAKQIDALGRAGDLAFAISTSGNSPSVLRAVGRCHKLGITTVGLTGGTGGRLASRVDHVLCVDGSTETARIQETHILIGHTICELVEVNLARRQTERSARRSRMGVRQSST
jgi:D-sedoheptulose 7-phosphate isomerase